MFTPHAQYLVFTACLFDATIVAADEGSRTAIELET
jgi:hypothetical protein